MQLVIGALALTWVFAASVAIEEARADAARGLALAERWCSQCHGVRPKEASASPKAATFPDIAAEPSATEPSLRVFLRTPHASMPNLILQPDDIDDLVSYILSMKPAR